MSPLRFHRIMRAQIETLGREQLLDEDTVSRLLERYPESGWDWTRLGRWFGLFGAVSAALGLGLLARQVFEFTLEKLAIALLLAIGAAFWGGWRLRHRGMQWTGRSLELLGGMCLIGLSFTLGVIYSTGSGNWPMLLLIDWLLVVPLAYLRRNGLLLVLAVVTFFTWFGGMTGYISGWGAYWFGMNYPLRFLMVGLIMVGVGIFHRTAESGPLRAYRDFFKIWLSAGLFFSEMALWLMSLFGNYERVFQRYLESAGELFVFNLLWAGFNLALLVLGSRYRLSMLRAYAMTFLIIQAYTLFFWKVAGHLGPVLSTFLAGSVTLWGVFRIEQRRRAGAPVLPGADD